jgi:hypothetical protein
MHIHHEFNQWKFYILDILKHYIMFIFLPFPLIIFNNNSKMHIKKEAQEKEWGL